MSLIFDKFPNEDAALNFRDYVRGSFGIGAQFYTSNDDAQQADPFPWELCPPIVHVNRDRPDVEESVIRLAKSYGATFAGT